MSERPAQLTIWLAAAVVIAFVLSLCVGPGLIGFGGDAAARLLILREIRLPRALLGACVGAALGLSGAALQGYLRNPLAEPGVIGVSGGAALGAVLAIHLGLASAAPFALPAAGLIGATIATLLVVMLAGEGTGPVPLMLAGVAVSALTSAAIALSLTISGNPFAAAESVFWMMGSLADRSLTQAALAIPVMAGGMVLLMQLARTLDALTLGESAARSLGVDLKRARRLLIGGVALSVGAATAVTGIIGFVGLVVPHLLRRYTGHQPSRLLAASALGGAALLLLADTALRLLSPWLDIRIGVLTALLGAPFFVVLVARMRRDLAP
jgi:iron complex transport system permease protein